MCLKTKSVLLFSICCLYIALLLPVNLNGQVVVKADGYTDTLEIDKLIKVAEAQRRLSNFDSAINLSKKALKRSKVIRYEKGIANSMLQNGFCYLDKGDYRKSKALLYEAYPHCIKVSINDKRIMSSLYNSLGGIYALLGNNDSAIRFFHLSLNSYERRKVNDSTLLMLTYNNLGTAWMQKGDYDLALHYQQKAKIFALQLNDSLYIATIFSSIGTTYFGQKELSKAMQYLNLALNIYKKYPKNINDLQFLYYTMGRIEQVPQKSLVYFNDALNLDSTSALCASIYQGIGGAYYLMGKYSISEVYYKKSQLICKDQNLMMHRLVNYQYLALINQQLKRYEIAYNYQVKYSNLNDSILNAENYKTVSLLDVKYRTTSKDRQLMSQELLLVQKESKLLKNNIGLSAVLLGSIFIITFLIVKYKNKQKLQQKLLENTKQNHEIERLHYELNGKELERNRIARELHDGVSVLLTATQMTYSALGKENIGMTQTETYKEVMDLLRQTSKEVRNISLNLTSELLLQESLPSAIKSFCDLIQKRHQLNIQLQTYGAFENKDHNSNHALYRIVQELLHNIVKHAHATVVFLQLTQHNNLLQITVEDNGIGFEHESSKGGMGIANLNARINEMNGLLTYRSKLNKGTIVEIEIPTI